MNVADVRDGIAAALNTIPGLRGHATFPDLLVPPAGFVGSHAADYHQYFGGGMTAMFPVVLVTTRAAGDRRANDELDKYLAPTGDYSVKEAVEADPTLGGACSDCTVTGYEEYDGTFESGGELFASVMVNVRVED